MSEEAAERLGLADALLKSRDRTRKQRQEAELPAVLGTLYLQVDFKDCWLKKCSHVKCLTPETSW
eukprot:12312958-Prorocentrum_lima.AAC.1